MIMVYEKLGRNTSGRAWVHGFRRGAAADIVLLSQLLGVDLPGLSGQ